ncbi:MAG TPA: glycoside hydrolase family 38 C-terminal domain-containing protein [Ruminiclostridium sp.]
MNKIHLLCNAHLDPVWLWEWEEGAAAAISTFRVAADFCEEFDGFIFNHNEVTLYKWVEEYEPELFARIQRLVKEGKWHIMGGWYLQPDCNMPSGESFVRQILLGRQYFKDKFGVEPTTAINFDPFGHSRGLVQIMKKSGYDSYLFCRPAQVDCNLPSDEFTWVGFDGSEIIGHRVFGFYNTPLGKAVERVTNWMTQKDDKELGLILWGVGDHGGGPSRIDLNNLKKFIKDTKDYEIVHSTPENYFKEVKARGLELPRHEGDLNSWAAGCYTSQIRIKQKHRLLENEIFMLEKMMSHASLQNYLKYTKGEIHEALLDLMVSQFHDILPGSSIQPVEDASIRLLDHGLEIVSKLKARAFFSLAQGQEKAKEGEIPILIYNPHPYKIKGNFQCEFQLADQNLEDEFTLPTVYQNGEKVPSQPEKELSNLNMDWRKRVVIYTELEPSSMNRFDCRLEILPEKPKMDLKAENGKISFKTEELDVEINCSTGLIDRYSVNGKNYLMPNAFLPLAIEDNEDPWGMTVNNRFRNIKGSFKLLSREEGSKFSGVKEQLLDSVRVVEDGEVRTVVEAVFKYENSFICQTYKLPKKGTELEVQIRVQWAEKSTMLKLSVPTIYKEAKYFGQVAFGVQELPLDGKEGVSQKWVAIVSDKDNGAFTCINDGVYGSDFKNGELRLSLLRSPGYSGHPIQNRSILPQDRFSPRIDQGERLFNFWFNCGDLSSRLESIEKEAIMHNEKPFVLSFFPSGLGKKPVPLIEISDATVQMSTFKKAENSEDYIIRLFESTGNPRKTEIVIPYLNIKEKVSLGKFEIKTLKLNLGDNKLIETKLME